MTKRYCVGIDLPDVNILLALFNQAHAHHDGPARAIGAIRQLRPDAESVPALYVA